jgi:RNA polymerase sigma-70 factor (sigma-E family)
VPVADDLAAFVQREYPRLVAVLSAHCCDRHVAEELAQEALVRACDRWSHVQTLDNPGAWVQRVALNLAGSWFRRRQAERRAVQRHGPPPVHTDADTADRLAVRDAVLGLPGRQRTALALRFYLRLSVAEAAQVMGCSEAAVKAHTGRAVAALRNRFGHDQVPVEVSDD